MGGETLRGAWTRAAWGGLSAFVIVGCAQIIGVDWGEYAVEDVCKFLKDPSSCYAGFSRDVGDRCGSGASGERDGTFVNREHLDVCFLDRGGQVVFDPPLDLEKFPLQSVAFRLLDAQAEECGTFAYSGRFDYSVDISPCRARRVDAGSVFFPQCDDGSGDERESVSVNGGAIAVVSAEGREEVTLTCADGSMHRLNRDHVAAMCAKYEETIPHAELDSAAPEQPPPATDPSSTDSFAGFVKFRVYYPSRLDRVDADGAALWTTPEIIEYFNCRIPPPPPLCFNREKDAFESDIDCGGALCRARCDDGQACGSDDDCVFGVCSVEDGSLKCQRPLDEGSGGAGG